MAKLVFDIETSALPLENFDEAQQEYLFRDAEKLAEEDERKNRRAEIQRFFSLWPLTARVVCIAMVNADTLKGQVLYLNPESQAPDPLRLDNGEKATVDFIACKEETGLLRGFWDVAKKYDQIVTFNGRGFDVPFVYLRSAVNNVPISRRDWLGYRYTIEPHCDLAEQLTFYGVSGRDGAARRFNLDFYCKAFGIESPKSQGITGMDVTHLMEKGRYRDIAEYCLRDVKATVELYHIWRERLAGIK
jgi:DNA polymerase elongation subunit (family B)